MEALKKDIQAVQGLVLDYAGNDVHDAWMRIVKALSSPLPAEPVAPDGWVLVPKVPTKKMVEAAGGEEVDLYRADDPSYRPADVWADMIAAAPPAPAHSAEKATKGEGSSARGRNPLGFRRPRRPPP